MTPLRQKMIRELELQRLQPSTVNQYVSAVIGLAQFYHRSPDKISREEVRSYLHYLLVDRKLAAQTINGAVVAIHFFYRRVLGQDDFQLNVRCKRPGKLPEPISREEVRRLPLRFHSLCLPQLPQPPLSEMPEPGQRTVASAPLPRAVAHLQALARCRQQLDAPQPTEEPPKRSVAETVLLLTGVDITRCPQCGAPLKQKEFLPDQEPSRHALVPYLDSS